jgi:hypothetical protein
VTEIISSWGLELITGAVIPWGRRLSRMEQSGAIEQVVVFISALEE